MMEEMNKWLSAQKAVRDNWNFWSVSITIFMADISGSDHTVPFTGHSGCSRIVFL